MFDDVLYIDNFYENPDEIRDFALSLPYTRNKDTSYPGIRTRMISQDRKDLRVENCNDILLKKYYYNFLDLLKEKCNLFDVDKSHIETGFHKIQIFSNDLDSPLNTGFIHTDLLAHRFRGKKTFAGLIYLNKITRLNSGTSIFKLKNSPKHHLKITDGDNQELFHNMFANDCEMDYNRIFDEYVRLYNSSFVKSKYLDEFIDYKNLVDSKFEKIFELENVYNRIVIYDSSYFHTSSNFYVNNFEPRLTQVFFIVVND